MKKSTLTLIAATTLALGLSACGSDPMTTAEKMADAEASATEAADSQSDREKPLPTPSETQEAGPYEIGDTVEYDDGLELTAQIVDTVSVSDVASTTCSVGSPVTVIELTVTNNTGTSINPWEDFSEDLRAQYTDGSNYVVAADDVFDSADYNGGYELSGGQNFATIRTGQTGSDFYGFCTDDMLEDTLWLSIDPSPWAASAGENREPVEWTNETSGDQA